MQPLLQNITDSGRLQNKMPHWALKARVGTQFCEDVTPGCDTAQTSLSRPGQWGQPVTQGSAVLRTHPLQQSANGWDREWRSQTRSQLLQHKGTTRYVCLHPIGENWSHGSTPASVGEMGQSDLHCTQQEGNAGRHLRALEEPATEINKIIPNVLLVL